MADRTPPSPSRTSSPVHAALKEGTLAAHRAAEQALPGDKIMDGSITEREYGDLLQTHFILLTRLERDAHAEKLPMEIRSDLTVLHTSLIPDLLVHFGSSALGALREKPAEMNGTGEVNPGSSSTSPAPAAEQNEPPIAADPAHAYAEFLGRLYVSFGSTMGGRMMARKLKHVPALKHWDNHHFFGACSDFTQEWPEFLRYLSKKINPEHVPYAVAAANAAFADFRATYARLAKA